MNQPATITEPSRRTPVPGRYILPSRDLIVNDIEVAAEGALLD